MSFFFPLYKANEATKTVWARAAAEELDKANEIMDYATARPQFEAWSGIFSKATMGKSLGNIRAMHNPKHLAGKVQEIVYDDAGKTVDICLKVLDPVDWIKVTEGGYTGLSIGGGYARKWPDPLHKNAIRYTPRIAEISLVDNPCMKSAIFLELHKRDGAVEEIMLKGHPRSFAELQPPPSFADLLKAFDDTKHPRNKGKFTRRGAIAEGAGAGAGGIVGGVGGILAARHPVGIPLGVLGGTLAGYHAGKFIGRHLPGSGKRISAERAKNIRENSASLAGAATLLGGATAVGRVLRPRPPKMRTGSYRTRPTKVTDPDEIARIARILRRGARAAGRGATTVGSEILPFVKKRADIINNLEKIKLGETVRTVGTLGRQAGAAIGRGVNHPVTQGTYKTIKTAGTVSTLLHGAAGLGAAATAVGAGLSLHSKRKQRHAMPSYMQKSLAGELVSRAGRFAASYASAAKGTLGRTTDATRVLGGAATGAAKSRLGQTRLGGAVGRAAAHPRVAAAASEIKHTGWHGAVAPLHTIARAGGAAIGGARGARIGGRIGLAGDYAPVAYTAGKLTGAIPDRKPAEKMAKASPEARAKIAQTMHEWKAGKLRSYRGVNPRSGKPRRGPKVHDQRQAIAIALSQARRAEKNSLEATLAERMEKLAGRVVGGVGGYTIGGRVGAGAGAALGGGIGYLAGGKPGARVGAVLGTKGGQLAGRVVGGLKGWELGRRADDEREKERLKKPNYMKKWVGPIPVTGKFIPRTPGHVYRYNSPKRVRGPGPNLTYNDPKHPNPGLALPGYMSKSPAELFLDRLEKRDSGEDDVRYRATSPMKGNEAVALYEATRAETHSGGALSSKEHDQRVAAAKARWMKEGHHDLDVHFDAQAKSAAGAWLGAKNKVAAIEAQRHSTWSGVATAQAAYDKVKHHVGDKGSVLMEVPHSHGLLYNPEGLGRHSFNGRGKPLKPLHLVHPDEADDWVAKHGKDGVAKHAPEGLITNITELGQIVGSGSRQFVRLAA